MRGFQRRVGSERAGAPRVLPAIAALLAVAITPWLPILIVVVLLVLVDAGVLIYWFGVRPRRATASRHVAALAPMRRLAEIVRIAGILLVVNALLVTLLGFLTQSGITSEATAKWGALTASGVQVQPEQPAAFGAKVLVVAAAVWLVGFGLTKASGEKA